MHVKIIEVVEVTEFVEEPMFGEQGGSIVSRPKRKYFLRDGTKLEVYDPFLHGVPATTITMVGDDPNVYAGTTAGGLHVPQTN
jgi:hypothetical protein